MKNKLLFSFILGLNCALSYAQDKSILVFDLENGSIDTITNIIFNPSISNETSPFNIGDDQRIENLEQTPPIEGVFPNTQFSTKKKVDGTYDLNAYPIRTSVKIFYIKNDTLKDLCSGSFISEQHVLSAAHCYTRLNTNNLLFDTLLVCPAFDKGIVNPDYNCSYVRKVKVIKDWDFNTDFAVLELKEAVGKKTGWLGLAFDDRVDPFDEDIFYKFSYPNNPVPFVDEFPYNGDSLYYNYGKVTLLEDWIGVLGANGVNGESGSSIIRVQNNEAYHTFGVMSFGLDLKHSRFSNETYFLIKHLIKDALVSSSANISQEKEAILYPNPSSGLFQIKYESKKGAAEITIYDALGRKVFSNLGHYEGDIIDANKLKPGLYIVTIKIGDSFWVKKIFLE